MTNEGSEEVHILQCRREDHYQDEIPGEEESPCRPQQSLTQLLSGDQSRKRQRRKSGDTRKRARVREGENLDGTLMEGDETIDSTATLVEEYNQPSFFDSSASDTGKTLADAEQVTLSSRGRNGVLRSQLANDEAASKTQIEGIPETESLTYPRFFDSEDIRDLEDKVYNQLESTSIKDFLIRRKFDGMVKLALPADKLRNILANRPVVDPSVEADAVKRATSAETAVTTDAEACDSALKSNSEYTKTLEEMVYSNLKSTCLKDLLSRKRRFDGVVTLKLDSEKLKRLQNEDLRKQTCANGTRSIDSEIDPVLKNEMATKKLNLGADNNGSLVTTSDPKDSLNIGLIPPRWGESQESELLKNYKSASIGEILARRSFNGKIITSKSNKDHLMKLESQSQKPLEAKRSGPKPALNSLFSSMMRASRMSHQSSSHSHKEFRLPQLSRSEFLVLDQSSENQSFSVPRRKTYVSLDEFRGEVPTTIDERNEPPKKIYTYEPAAIDSPREHALQRLPNLHKNGPLRAILNMIELQNYKQGMWVDMFQPRSMDELLLHKRAIQQLRHWFADIFMRVANSSVPRKQKSNKKRDNFVVFDDDDLESVEHVSPVLVLQGKSGYGKSTAIHTAMRERQGYVHEIHCGDQRGRKDVFNSLKQFCTSHDVTKYEEGLVLFDDVDIIFDEDQGFWKMVEDICSITKRPIVLTCEDLATVPDCILDCAEVIELDEYAISKKLVKDYVWLCCLVNGFDLDSAIIDEIIGESQDIRKCLMQSQIICSIPGKNTVTAVKKPARDEQVPVNENVSIYEETKLIDQRSCNDLTSASLHLNLHDEEEDAIEQSARAQKLDKWRDDSVEFFGSRSIFAYFRNTRANNPSPPSCGVPQDSCLVSTATDPFVLEVLPFGRVWQVFQTEIDQFEKKATEEGKSSLKQFLRYRDFQYASNLDESLRVDYDQHPFL
ncbi:uncharacterized protein LODBEIA_P19960 [Lodderomyces beijingensis]|uniref:ATPase AAA-type core domain-containing protein n=1 Tax=Lodderomyces beijingensis TaxID=1775926 RepID=A0ABP0ZNL5_9ASCO